MISLTCSLWLGAVGAGCYGEMTAVADFESSSDGAHAHGDDVLFDVLHAANESGDVTLDDIDSVAVFGTAINPGCSADAPVCTESQAIGTGDFPFREVHALLQVLALAAPGIAATARTTREYLRWRGALPKGGTFHELPDDLTPEETHYLFRRPTGELTIGLSGRLIGNPLAWTHASWVDSSKRWLGNRKALRVVTDEMLEQTLTIYLENLAPKPGSDRRAKKYVNKGFPDPNSIAVMLVSAAKPNGTKTVVVVGPGERKPVHEPFVIGNVLKAHGGRANTLAVAVFPVPGGIKTSEIRPPQDLFRDAIPIAWVTRKGRLGN